MGVAEQPDARGDRACRISSGVVVFMALMSGITALTVAMAKETRYVEPDAKTRPPRTVEGVEGSATADGSEDVEGSEDAEGSAKARR